MADARSGARRSLCAERTQSAATSPILDPVNMPSTSTPPSLPPHTQRRVPESASDLADAPQVLTRLGVGRRGRRGHDASSVRGAVHELNAPRAFTPRSASRVGAPADFLLPPRHAPARLPASRHLPSRGAHDAHHRLFARIVYQILHGARRRHLKSARRRLAPHVRVVDRRDLGAILARSRRDLGAIPARSRTWWRSEWSRCR